MKHQVLLAIVLLALPLPCVASEGSVEINQARALAGGITPGDGPGFPVTLSQAGSYRLTSSLSVPGGIVGIDVAADSVALDLNGFAIRGPAPCGPGSRLCQGTSPGISGAAQKSLTVRNGSVSNFPGTCVALGATAHAERLLVQGCGIGIETQSGLVVGNRVRDSGLGLRLGSSSFRDNVVSAGGPSVEGGRALGGNLCADRRCTRDGRRRFYLTPDSVYTGGQAPTTCAPGFHFATWAELVDLSSLVYDAHLGATLQDVDTGPPADLAGWTANGLVALPNCLGWTDSSSSRSGHTRYIEVNLDGPALKSLPSVTCDTPLRVWCVED